MTTMTAPAGTVTGGVDTHLDVHVAAAVDHLGGVLGTASFATNRTGYRKLLAWLRSHGPLHKVGVEGPGSYGSALVRHLAVEGFDVVIESAPVPAVEGWTRGGPAHPPLEDSQVGDCCGVG